MAQAEIDKFKKHVLNPKKAGPLFVGKFYFYYRFSEQNLLSGS